MCPDVCGEGKPAKRRLELDDPLAEPSFEADDPLGRADVVRHLARARAAQGNIIGPGIVRRRARLRRVGAHDREQQAIGEVIEPAKRLCDRRERARRIRARDDGDVGLLGGDDSAYGADVNDTDSVPAPQERLCESRELSLVLFDDEDVHVTSPFALPLLKL